MKKSTSVLFFLVGRRAPATRFRFHQFEQELQKQGVTYRFLYTLSTMYLWAPRGVKHTPLKYLFYIPCLIQIVVTRLFQIIWYARRYDTIVVQRSFLHGIKYPFLERTLVAYLEFLRERNSFRLILDIDDATFLNARGEVSESSPALYLARESDLILAGNAFLSEHLGFPEKTQIVPTTVRLKRYEKIPVADGDVARTVIGWTGLASNLHYLTEIADVFEELSRRHHFTLLIICEKGTSAPFFGVNVDVQMCEWSEQSEIKELSKIDIGVMPLRDSKWEQGKCGFKLIQYMALGCPVVGSPVGVNAEIVEQGLNGYLATNQEEWLSALDRLLSNPDLRKQMGAEARSKIAQAYSSESWDRVWVRAISGEE